MVVGVAAKGVTTPYNDLLERLAQMGDALPFIKKSAVPNPSKPPTRVGWLLMVWNLNPAKSQVVEGEG